ncbi:MAG: glycosyltransferase [Verrucomicrobiales bacterium]|nr:glycosyltransferase [Verrucomicrobiales bacterium]
MNARLLWNLRNEGISIRVISTRPVLPGARKRILERSASDPLSPSFIDVPYIPKFGSRWNDRLMRNRLRPAVFKTIKDFQPDLVLGAWMFPDCCAVSQLAKEANLPSVLIAQGSDLHQYLSNPFRRRKILDAVAESGATITRSKSLQQLLTNAGAQQKKILTIYNGVDTQLFHLGEKGAVRAALDLPQDTPIALFVGNLLPIKDPELLLHAFAKLRRKSQLVILGAGPLDSALKQLAGKLGIAKSIHFAGPQPPEKVALYMQAADTLCMSSKNEGLPNVILEAFASGLPVVSTNVGGVSEVVTTPELGTLTAPSNAEEYAIALNEQLSSKPNRDSIRKQGVAYSWKHACEQYLEIFQRVVTTHPH